MSEIAHGGGALRLTHPLVHEHERKLVARPGVVGPAALPLLPLLCLLLLPLCAAFLAPLLAALLRALLLALQHVALKHARLLLRLALRLVAQQRLAGLRDVGHLHHRILPLRAVRCARSPLPACLLRAPRGAGRPRLVHEKVAGRTLLVARRRVLRGAVVVDWPRVRL